MQKILILLSVSLACVIAEPAASLLAAPLTAAAYTAPLPAAYNAPLVAAAPYTAPAFAAYTNAPLDSAFASQRLDIFNNYNFAAYPFAAAPERLIAAAPAAIAAPARFVAAAPAPARLVTTSPYVATNTAFTAPIVADRYISPSAIPAPVSAPAKLVAPAVSTSAFVL